MVIVVSSSVVVQVLQPDLYRKSTMTSPAARLRPTR
jgi:hypothetical protein